MQCIWLLAVPFKCDELSRAQAKPAAMRALISGLRLFPLQDREAAQAKHCNAQLALHMRREQSQADRSVYLHVADQKLHRESIPSALSSGALLVRVEALGS